MSDDQTNEATDVNAEGELEVGNGPISESEPGVIEMGEDTLDNEFQGLPESAFKRDPIIGLEKHTIFSDDIYLQNMGEYFEPEMCRVFASLIEREDSVLDIGANIGCTAILFGQLASKVSAFEPSPSTFQFLEKNVGQSHLANIELFNIGLGETEAEMKLTRSPRNRSGGYVSNKTHAGGNHIDEKIIIKPGDHVIQEQRVDFIKIDVEGFEKSVISGLSNTIKSNRPTVILELNHLCLNLFQRTSVPEFLEFLRDVFPILLAFDEDHYCDLHDLSTNYHVMYQHLVHSKYQNLVGAFDEPKLEKFFRSYRQL